MPTGKKVVWNDEVFTQEFHDKYLPLYEAIRAKQAELSDLNEKLTEAMLSIGAINYIPKYDVYSPATHFRSCMIYLEGKKSRPADENKK